MSPKNCNWSHSFTVSVPVMLIAAVAGHSIIHKWEQNQIWGNQMSQCCKLLCQSPGFTWFQAQTTPKLALLRQEESCWKKGWLLHEGGKKEKHLNRMPSLLRAAFLPGREAGCANSLWLEAMEHNKGRWTSSKIHGMIHARTWGGMKPCTLDGSTNVRDGTWWFLICFNVLTWLTSPGYSTF